MPYQPSAYYYPVHSFGSMTSRDLNTTKRGNTSNPYFASSQSTRTRKKSRSVPLISMEKDLDLDEYTDARMLFIAIRKGKIRLVRFILIATDRDVVNSVDMGGKSPLIIACYVKEESSRFQIVKALLESGADVNMTDDYGRTALSYASEYRYNDVIDLLVKCPYMDPDIPDKDGNTPLIYCAKEGNDVGIDLLTRHFRRLGLAVDHANHNGYTALLMAAKHENIACLKILINQGHASVLHRDYEKKFSVQEWLIHHGYSKSEILQLMPSNRNPRRKFVDAINIARLLPSTKIRKERQTEKSPVHAPFHHSSSRLSLPIVVDDYDQVGKNKNVKRKIARHMSLEDSSDQEKYILGKLHSLHLPTIRNYSPMGTYESADYDSDDVFVRNDTRKHNSYRPRFQKSKNVEQFITFASSSDENA